MNEQQNKTNINEHNKKNKHKWNNNSSDAFGSGPRTTVAPGNLTLILEEVKKNWKQTNMNEWMNFKQTNMNK